MKPRPLHWLALILILLFFAAFLLYPIARILQVGFLGIGPAQHFTLAYLFAVFQDPTLRIGLLHSALIAISVTALCTLITIPLALLYAKYNFPLKSFFSTLLLVPLILPPFVGAIGMRQIIGRFGVLSAIAWHLHLAPPGSPINWFGSARFAGVILLESLSLYPILLLNLTAALANIDPAMEQAAANLGASPWTVFRRITLPLMRPGLFAGATIVAIWSFTELGTPLMLDYYDVTPVQVFRQLTQVNGSPIPYALVVVMLTASIVLYLTGKLILGRRPAALISKASIQSPPCRLTGPRALVAIMPFAILATLALLPHLAVMLLSLTPTGQWYMTALPHSLTLDHYAAVLTNDVTTPSMRNSILLAFSSMLLDVALGLTIAWLLVRSRLPFKGFLDALSMLPLAVPGLVLAFGFLAISFQAQIWLGQSQFRSWVDVRENPALLLIIAYAMRRLPYVVRSAVAGLEQTPQDLDLAARNLGASAARTLRRITAPLIAPNLLAGALLAFAFAMLEVSDSLILAQKQTYWPITKAIYDLFGRLGDGPYVASALGVWAMAVLALTLLAAGRLTGRRLGNIFRV